MRVCRLKMRRDHWVFHLSAVMRSCEPRAGPLRPPRRNLEGVDEAVVAAVFTASGSVNQAAKAAGISHSSARKLLIAAGFVGKERRPRGKAEADPAIFRARPPSGWSAARAAREVGVNVRTARDWRDGVRKVANTRVYPDGTVIDYTTGARYTQPVITSPSPGYRCRS